MRKNLIFLLSCLILSSQAISQVIRLMKHDATVWSQDVLVRGMIDTSLAREGDLLVNGSARHFTVAPASAEFLFSVRLGPGETILVARADSAGAWAYSDTVALTLGFRPRPEVSLRATIVNREVQLHAEILENPDSSALSYFWSFAPRNPAELTWKSMADTTATTEISLAAPAGEYSFSLTVIDGDGDSTIAGTLVIADSSEIVPFNIRTDHCGWIDSAVVYEISPYFFVENGSFDAITEKLPELRELGINVVWLQPVTKTNEPYQGYHVTDYFGLRQDLGTEDDLRKLVSSAHALEMKVLLDFVPNHSTLYHPYAQDAILYGPSSHYYDFYQRSISSAFYSWTEYIRTDGLMQFVYYFWDQLVNWNYDNPEVRRMMIEAGRYWIEKFDIDGYRIDAVWGVNDRRPEFMKEWRIALKRIKPQVFLLGEDKATEWSSFDERFDAAYDWACDRTWISLWAWARGAGSTVTNFTSLHDAYKSNHIRRALTNWGNGFHPRAKILRYMENNDVDRFLYLEGHAKTRMVAAFMFSLNGIPLLYNGQEIGVLNHPYSGRPVFREHIAIQSLDEFGLLPYYRNLMRLRQRLPALRSENYEEIPVLQEGTGEFGGQPYSIPNSFVFAYRRWQGAQQVICVMNMHDSVYSPKLVVPVSRLSLDSSRSYYLTDLLSGEATPVTWSDLDTLSVKMNPNTTRMFIIADTVFLTSAQSFVSGQEIRDSELQQNYPNPFNPTTTIRYSLPRTTRVLLRVFDLLGREICTLVDEVQEVGSHRAQFSGERLASGVYIYRLETDTQVASRMMVLIR